MISMTHRLISGFTKVITVFTVFRLLTDFVCLYTYEFRLSLCKIVRSLVILLLPLSNPQIIKYTIDCLPYNLSLPSKLYDRVFKN